MQLMFSINFRVTVYFIDLCNHAKVYHGYWPLPDDIFTSLAFYSNTFTEFTGQKVSPKIIQL